MYKDIFGRAGFLLFVTSVVCLLNFVEHKQKKEKDKKIKKSSDNILFGNCTKDDIICVFLEMSSREYYNWLTTMESNICNRSKSMTNCYESKTVLTQKIMKLFKKREMVSTFVKSGPVSDILMCQENMLFVVEINSLKNSENNMLYVIHSYVVLKIGSSFYKLQSYKNTYSITDYDKSIKHITQQEFIEELNSLAKMAKDTIVTIDNAEQWYSITFSDTMLKSIGFKKSEWDILVTCCHLASNRCNTVILKEK